jgi:CheY-like chemotaxis protein
MHGGGIGVASEAGLGSTFTFFIKTRRTIASVSSTWIIGIRPLVNNNLLKEVYGEGLPTVESSSTESLGSQTEIGSKASSRYHFLVVEDNLVNQQVVSRQLRSYGCIVSVANHGKEALDFIRTSHFWGNVSEGKRLSVVLMDLEMPMMDGMTCVKRIRELQVEGKIRGHVPVMAVTADTRKDHLVDAMAAGMVRAAGILF